MIVFDLFRFFENDAFTFAKASFSEMAASGTNNNINVFTKALCLYCVLHYNLRYRHSVYTGRYCTFVLEFLICAFSSRSKGCSSYKRSPTQQKFPKHHHLQKHQKHHFLAKKSRKKKQTHRNTRPSLSSASLSLSLASPPRAFFADGCCFWFLVLFRTVCRLQPTRHTS